MSKEQMILNLNLLRSNMNIFYLSNNVTECAEQHVDKHCVKMILEYAQLLSTAHRFLDGTVGIVKQNGRNLKQYTLTNPLLENILYKATHANHPSAVWVRLSAENYQWLTCLLAALCTEYTYRYKRVHKVESSGLLNTLLFNVPKNIPFRKFSEPTPAMPDEFKTASSIESYRNYYTGSKSHMFVWKNREVPNWITTKESNANLSI